MNPHSNPDQISADDPTPAGAEPFLSQQRQIPADLPIVTQALTVCHPVWRLGCGGLENQMTQVIPRLPQSVFRHVYVVRGADVDDLARFDPGPNADVVHHPANGPDRLYSIQLASVLREHSVDILHVRGFSMLIDAMMAVRLSRNVKLAFSFHGFEKPDRNFGAMRRRAYRAAVLRCDACWAVSRTAADEIARVLDVEPERFEVISNGVDTLRFAPAEDRQAIRELLGLPLDRQVVLCVGNLKPIKGQDVLLEAIERLDGPVAEAVFVFIGADHEDGRLQRWAAEAMPDVDVRFVGAQADVLPWYQAADLLVLPSRYEGMSNVLLEAMSVGLPVIATAVGGNIDVLDQGRTGLLVRPENPDELRSAIEMLSIGESYRRQLAEEGRRHVQEHCAIHRTVENYTRLYKSLAANSPARLSPKILEEIRSTDS